MANPGRLSHAPSARGFFAPLVLALLFVSPLAASAQDSANGANSNNVNQNSNANSNRNANANNANANNANSNRNSNANGGQNGNVNSNANQNADNANANATRAAEIQRQGMLVGTWWYPFLVTSIFVVVLGLFAYAIYRSVRFSKSTFNSPLGLPEGSLRAMLAFLLVVFVGFYVYASVLSFSDFQPPQFLLGIVATVVGFYFGSRSAEDKGGAVARTGTVQGNVVDRNGSPAVGATVDLSQAGVSKHTQTADASGAFTFGNVPVGTYNISANLAGQGPSVPAKVTVAAGAPQTVSLKLT